MKKGVFLLSGLLVICFASSITLVSCKKEESKKEPLYPKTETTTIQAPEELGKVIFGGKGNCVACHQIDRKTIGPSVREIAKIYKDKNGDMISFFKGEGEPLVDPSQYEVMKTNFAITKTMSDEELKALEAYVYSNLK